MLLNRVIRNKITQTRLFSTKQACIVNASRVDWNENLDYSYMQKSIPVNTHFDGPGIDPTNDQFIERAQGCEVIVTKEIPVRGDIINALPSSVKLIAEAGTGFNNIDVDIARQRGITVCNIPAYSNDAVAQLVINQVLNFSSSMIQQQRSLWEGDKSNFTQALQVPHFELQGKTIGLVAGTGTIGQSVTKIAEVLGMNIIISTRSSQEECNRRSTENITYTNYLPLLLESSDFVSIHCPLNKNTHHSINADSFEMMKNTAFFINTARGSIVDELALIEALQTNQIAGAAIDVQEVEPPALDNPLYTLPNVILTPHIGWKRLESRQRSLNMVADNISAFYSGKPKNVVNN